MEVKIVKANVNDRPVNAGLLLISEPNYIPESNSWFSSEDGKAVIFCDLNVWRTRVT